MNQIVLNINKQTFLKKMILKKMTPNIIRGDNLKTYNDYYNISHELICCQKML